MTDTARGERKSAVKERREGKAGAEVLFLEVGQTHSALLWLRR